MIAESSKSNSVKSPNQKRKISEKKFESEIDSSTFEKEYEDFVADYIRKVALNLFFVIGFQPGHFDFKILGSFLQRSSTDYKKIDMFLHLILSILFEKNLSSDEFFNIIHSEKSNSELKINSKLLGMTYCLVDQLLFILKSQIEIYYTLCKKTESPTSTKNLKLKNLKYVSTFSFENYISSDIIALPS